MALSRTIEVAELLTAGRVMFDLHINMCRMEKVFPNGETFIYKCIIYSTHLDDLVDTDV